MPYEWTTERVAKLSNAELRSLLRNATIGNDIIVIQLCKVELNGRGKPSHAVSMKKLEEAANESLVCFTKQILEKFDLSQETAKAQRPLGESSITHRVLGSKGQSKLGGWKLAKKADIDRYISYRLGDKFVSLGMILESGKDEADARWFVFAPKTHTPDWVSKSALLPNATELSDENIGGRCYEDFEPAAEQFEAILASFAPRRVNMGDVQPARARKFYDDIPAVFIGGLSGGQRKEGSDE